MPKKKWNTCYPLFFSVHIVQWIVLTSTADESTRRVVKREGCLTGVLRGKGIERKTNGGNINPAKTKVYLADLTFPCARSRVCSPRSVFSSLRNGSFGKKRNGNIGKIAFVGVPGVHLVSADRRARQGSEGTGSSG